MDIEDIKEIPLIIEAHGVHEMCFEHKGEGECHNSLLQSRNPFYNLGFNLQFLGKFLTDICFVNDLSGDTPVSVSFGIDFKSKRARLGSDPSKKVVKEEIPSLESELLAAEESLNDISREIEFARKQEVLLTQATGAMLCLRRSFTPP